MSEDEKLLKEAKKWSWEDRLFHKNWKVRNDGNIDLAAACDAIADPKDPRLREFGSFFKKTVADSNAPVQEKALDALIAYLRAADADAGRYSKEICDAIVAKCLTGRPKTIEKAQNVFLLWVELEASEVFLEVMEKAIKNKVAKAVVPAIDVMFQAVSEFGTKIVPPKKILKMLSELFDHQDQNVRASAKGLTIELCRWIGKDPVKSILFEKMRDTMKKELEAELANVVVAPKPTRKIRSEQLKELEQEVVEAVECPRPVDEATASGPQEIDEYDLVDPVEILTQLEKSGFWEGVKAAKWSERRDAVAELTKLASVKKIAPGDFTEVCRTLKKLITDVNLAVGVEAVQATGNLAKGLRKDFGGGSRLLLPILLEKLKEKKAVMSDALTQTLQALHKAGCLSLVDVIEDVKLASKNKVPSVRSLTLNWVTFCIESSNKAVVLKLHKDYVPICMECLNDGTPDVRDAAFSALAAIAKLVGMKPLERSLEKLDDVRRNKLIEMIGSSGNAQMPSLPSGTSRAIPNGFGSSPSEADENGFVKRSAASMLSGKKLAPPNTQSAKKSTGKKADETKQSKAAAAIEAVEDIEPGEMSLEEIEGRVGSIFQEEVLPNLKSTIWKERLEAMNSLKETVESLSDLDQRAEILVRLVSALPGWGDKNVQVQQKVLEVITHIASTVSRFPKRCVVLCILGVAERVADIKTRIQAMQCLTAFCEAVGPNFIFDRLYKIMKEHKNPKVLSEGVTWMAAAVEDFGVSHIKLKDLIDFCKDTGLQSSAAATRNSTTKLIGILHKFVGPDIKGFLSDIKPALQTAIDAEFEKNPYEGPAATPKKMIKGLDSSLVSCGSGADGLPREDISGKISPTLIKNLSSPDWKVRLESIEAVNKILEEANNRIQPNGTGELFGALRARLFDSNKNLVMNTLIALGNIASAMGPAVEKSSKGIISDVLKCLSDNKKLMRESVIKALDLWAAAVQLDKMVPYIASALGDVKLGADGRKDLFDWLSRQLTKVNDQPDFVQLLKPTASCLQDKSVDVRKAAEASLAEVTRVCGQEMIAKAMKELQGPVLTAVLERQRTGILQEISEPTKAIVTTPGARSGVKSAKPIANGSGERPSSRSSHKVTASRTFPTKASKQAVALAAQDYAVQGQALFNLKDSNKEDRERPISRKYKFEEPRLEQIQELENDLVKHFREDLHRRLLSSDFKKHVDGLDLLQKAIPSHIKEMTEIVDILLRWTVFRFCESNTTCLLKVLEFLPEFVDGLKNEGYNLTEYEANVLLPCLIEKSGHNIEKVREKMRELTKLIAGIYPPPKLFAYILEGLRSKNNRSRIECVDHIGFMIDHYGVEIAGPSKALQIVAGLTSERDGELRKAALNTLAIAYKILGDDIWRYVGRLADAQKSMLDDKFKWKAREMEKRKEGKPGEARAALRRSVRDIGLEAAEQSDDFIQRPISSPVLPSIRTSHGHFEALADQQLVNGPATGPSNWKAAIDVIDCGSPDQAVEGMKFVCYELSQANNNSSSTAMDDLVNDADQLVSCLTTKVARTFSLVLVGASSRSCKYVLNTLMQTFQIKKVAHGVKEDTLYNLITELLLWLLDERVQLVDDGSQLLKALNVLMLKILENADRTSAFVVLIRLLQPLDPSKWPSQVSRDADAIRSHKFSDLIVKCLSAISVSALFLLVLNLLQKTPLTKHFDLPSSISSEINQKSDNNLQKRLVLEILMSAGCPKSLQIKMEDTNCSTNPIANLAALTNLASSISSPNRKWNLFRDLLKPPCERIGEPERAEGADSVANHATEGLESDEDSSEGLELEVKISAQDDVAGELARVADAVDAVVPPRVADWAVEAESEGAVVVTRRAEGKSKRKKNRKKKAMQKKVEELGGFIIAKNAASNNNNNNDNEGELGCTCGIGKGDYHHGSCPYPFTSSASVIQRRIKLQYDELVHSNAAKSLTLAQVGRFTNCLVEAKAALQQKSETIQRKFTIAKSLLAKADKSTFDRLCGQIYRLETEQKRLEEDTVVYNRLQEQLKLSPAYQKMVEYGRTHFQSQQNMSQLEKSDEEDDEISFEELLAQEKKDSFWQKHGPIRPSVPVR